MINGPGALAGLRVLDLSRVLAGPYCAQMLADHGADVVKVEAPTGDETRRWGPPFLDDEHTSSSYYEGLNRTKSNVVLDLRDERGRDVLLSLIAEADVVVENFKAGTMARWGLGYEDVLAERFPHLVYCRITGYGVDGPLGGEPGYDAVLQAYGGLMSVNGEADGEPLRVGVPIVDMMAANQAFSGVLLALFERSTSGLGQLVDITLLDAVLSILHPHSSANLRSGAIPRRSGGTHPTVAPYQVFQTAGDGRLFVAAASDAQFAALTDVLGRPDLATDTRFLHNHHRMANLIELVDELGSLIGGRDADELGAALAERGVPAAPVHNVAEALTAAQTRHRGMVVESDDYRGVGVPITLSRSGAVPPRPPAAIGADTDTVLTRAGWSTDAIAELRESGILGRANTTPSPALN